MAAPGFLPREEYPVSRDAELDALYAELPALDCLGLCHGSCGPILMSPAESARLAEHGTVIPLSWSCPALTMLRRCSVYEVRPLICRIWASVESMACPHGCRPDRWLTDVQARDLLVRAERISPVDSHSRKGHRMTH